MGSHKVHYITSQLMMMQFYKYIFFIIMQKLLYNMLFLSHPPYFIQKDAHLQIKGAFL